jgi:hypothetical protein
MNRLVSRFLLLSFLIALIASCGLHYTPPETPESFLDRRHNACEAYMNKNLGDSIIYSSIAFGETVVIKPASYRSLDSLYLLKYSNEKKGVVDKELDEIIEHQRMVVQNDTNKVIYKEFHVFSIKEGDSLRIVQSEFKLDQSAFVRDFKILESVLIPKKHNERYKQYLFNESFIYPGIIATEEEERFYNFYKSPLAELSPLDKDNLINHTLNLMEIGYKKKTVRVQDLLQNQARFTLFKEYKAIYEEVFSEIFSKNTIDEAGKETLDSYWFTYTLKDNDNPTKKTEYYFLFDAYLRLKTVTKL